LHFVAIPETQGDFYHIYIKYSAKRTISQDEYPDESSFDYHCMSPNNKTYENSPDKYELVHTCFIAANETKGNGTYYIGVKLASNSNEIRCEQMENVFLLFFSLKSFVKLFTGIDSGLKQLKPNSSRFLN
jgi:hypothetical protein